MAVRKTDSYKKTARKVPRQGEGRQGRVPFSVVFWIFCFIVFITLFLVLLPKVSTGGSLFMQQPKTTTVKPSADVPKDTLSPQTPAVPDTLAQQAPAEKPPARKSVPETQVPDKAPTKKPPVDKPSVDKPPADKPRAPAAVSAEKPVEQKPAQPAKPAPVSQVVEKPVETRSRGIYFMQESGADLQLVKVNRQLKVSDSPLVDCLNALFAGPAADEESRGIMSFVPPGARLISARVNGNTAILNVNEEFRYNTLGREGSAAQLKQIVWTATEFPNVYNVQIQIEGKIVDYLTEGISIRNPVSR